MRVLLAFPALLLLLGIVLVSLGLNGTSSGAYHSAVATGDDPDLIAGHPQQIRWDEWNVLTSWYIAQVEQGLPEVNETTPGGMDTAVPQDLPRRDWSVAFRPHLIGYTFLDLDQASAWKWWFPAFALLAAAYVFAVTLMPRRPLVAAGLAIGFYFSPFFHWWFLPGTHWPVAWALATMAGLVWAFARTSWRSRIVWAAVISYLTIVMVMGLYVPYIAPVALTVVFFAVGLLITRLRAGDRWRDALGRAVPIVAAAVVAAGVVLIWLRTKSKTVEAFLGTDYPGDRVTPTGDSSIVGLARLVTSAFPEIVNKGEGILDNNSSEASTFFFAGAFLIPVVIWAIVRQRRAGRPLPWEAIALTGVILIFLAYMFIPGWDAVAHLLFLDRAPGARIRIGIGLASFALLLYVIRHLVESETRAPRWIAIGVGAAFLLSQVAIAGVLTISRGFGQLWADAPLWPVYATVLAVSLVLFARRRIAVATLAFAVVCTVSTAGVNPVYRGVFDLRETALAQGIMATDDADPGTWVAVGGTLPAALVLESGVEAMNGVQGAPSAEMWGMIDPDDEYRTMWNRLGGINWIFEKGDEPRVFNPTPDQVTVTIDACSDFAQKHVDYILAPGTDVDESCLAVVESFVIPANTVTIYRVIAAP